ncbi:hypothetical protein AAW51_4943 [Caldimonas brevitalea]|uniref:Uncharacterized protein n=2 Tax=Caldimonas brevitalea TaxID=413882 RepID=A0A0G3BQD1_9BURK|nr:hypothetical protein [Caldimonas brevitalea]AKJ31634.1 hypothetical protein AAW51_4943 [Caldimonas brevitalea]
MLVAALASMAIVTQDQVPLRAGPRDSAAQQAVLWQGDTLEVRGERMGYLQVWDHRRERAGYVLASQVRTTSLKPEEAPELLAVVRFLRDTPGAEALGIGYTAAYLKAAPAGDITAEPFDALGSMAERLARRASAQQGSKASATVAAHLEVATHYGVNFRSYDHDGALRLCYDGEAFRRVLAMAASPEQQARAALAVTRHDCIDPGLPPVQRQQLDGWRAEVLDRLGAAPFAQLPEPLKNRLRLRRAGVWAGLAFQQARRGEGAQPAAQRALAELAGVNKTELSDADLVDYHQAAIRVGASRWAAETAPASPASRLGVITRPGQPGETCVMLTDASHGARSPLAERCTYGVVWTASASPHPNGRALALAVQPLEGWRELWVFRQDATGWSVDVMPPAASQPELGYVEFAGWVPGGEKLLMAREARSEGRLRRSFEVAELATLNVEKQASTPSLLVLFGKWQDAAWKRQTVSLR